MELSHLVAHSVYDSNLDTMPTRISLPTTKFTFFPNPLIELLRRKK